MKESAARDKHKGSQLREVPLEKNLEQSKTCGYLEKQIPGGSRRRGKVDLLEFVLRAPWQTAQSSGHWLPRT